MKSLLFFFAIVLCCSIQAQTTIKSKKWGTLEFVELSYGLAKVVDGTVEKFEKSPTGQRGWLKDLDIVAVTDSIKVEPKANFGVVYMINAKDTVDIKVTIEWIYPMVVENEKGERFKSIKYTTIRPTNTPSASTYSLDAPYEMLKGNWIENIYLDNKRVFTRTFELY